MWESVAETGNAFEAIVYGFHKENIKFTKLLNRFVHKYLIVFSFPFAKFQMHSCDRVEIEIVSLMP